MPQTVIIIFDGYSVSRYPGRLVLSRKVIFITYIHEQCNVSENFDVEKEMTEVRRLSVKLIADFCQRISVLEQGVFRFACVFEFRNLYAPASTILGQFCE